MATEVRNAGLGEARAASTASGGTALTSSAARIVLPLGTKMVMLTPRNFATAVVVKFNFNPWLVILKTTDGNATFTDYSTEAQDGSTSTSVTLSSLDTLANGDALYVGSHLPFSGVNVDIDAANGTASVLTVDYRKNDDTWADTSATDGTDSGGATMATDGSVTWTVPSDWTTARLQDLDADTRMQGLYGELYWTRWSVSAALDSSTTADHMLAINRDTTYAELTSGQALEMACTVGPGGIASVTALTDAGTANLIVNCHTLAGGRFA